MALALSVLFLPERCAKWDPKKRISPGWIFRQCRLQDIYWEWLKGYLPGWRGTRTHLWAFSHLFSICPPCENFTSILWDPGTTSRHPFSGVASSTARFAVTCSISPMWSYAGASRCAAKPFPLSGCQYRWISELGGLPLTMPTYSWFCPWIEASAGGQVSCVCTGWKDSVREEGGCDLQRLTICWGHLPTPCLAKMH